MPELQHRFFDHSTCCCMILVTLLHLAIIGWISYLVSKQAQLPGKIFWPALAVKLLAGIALGLVYSGYYSAGDTWVYFKDGAVLAGLAKSDPGAYLGLLW